MKIVKIVTLKVVVASPDRLRKVVALYERPGFNCRLVKWPGRLQEFNNNENCKNSYSKSGGGKSRPLTKGGRFIREARFQL